MEKKNFLKTVNKSLFTMKRRFLADETIRKLLYYTTPDALSQDAPEISLVEDYISLETFIRLEESDPRNNLITIDLMNADSSFDKDIIYTFNIKVYCDVDNLQLDSNSLRYYAISQKIVELLDDTSINTAGKVSLTKLALIADDDKFVGFNLEFLTIETTSVEEFS